MLGSRTTPATMSHLDRTSTTPLHVQLQRALLDDIISAKYRPGSVFATEREIAELYHVSRTTIRSALDELVRLGYLTRQRGKGTFVTRSEAAFDATRLSSFTEDMRKEGRTAGGTILALRRGQPPQDAQRHFGTGVGDVWRIQRLRTADGEPIALQTSYVRADRFQLTEAELRDGSLYALLADKYGVTTTSADEIITARVANKRDAQSLRIHPGDPLLCVDRFTFSQDGEPVEYVQIQYRGDRYRFFVHQHRGG